MYRGTIRVWGSVGLRKCTLDIMGNKINTSEKGNKLKGRCYRKKKSAVQVNSVGKVGILNCGMVIMGEKYINEDEKEKRNKDA